MQALESHSFEPVRLLQWRNTDLDFASLGALQVSLAVTPKEPGLTRAPIAEDILVLEHAARDESVRAVAKTRNAVERLWDVCQVPDYRKIAPATHAELAVTLYGFLMREGHIPTDWFARQIALADHTDGGIDALSNRIAHVRTWTFVANRPDWLADPEHWQGVTRAVEDKLSDALHERLAERFVDRRTSVLMRRLKESTMLETEIGKTGEVVVEGHVIGRLDGFVFARRRLRPADRKPRPCRPPRRRRWPVKSMRAPRGFRKRRTNNSCSPPTARSAGRATPSASSLPRTKCCVRACASSPTSS